MAFTLGNGKVATIKSLKEAGVIDVDGSGEVKPLPGTAEADYTPPPAPTGLTAGGALATVMLSWDASASVNISYTEVWRADSNDFGSAQLIGRADGRIYTDGIGGGALRYYWIRYISKMNIPGPYNAQAGVPGETGNDPSYLISVLSANPPNGANFNKLLYVQNSPTVINGVSVPAGTYMSQAYISDGSISNAKIGNAAIDNAKIASLDAAKITTGYIDAARINVGSLDAKIATLNAAVIGSGFINSARINTASITNATITNAQIAGDIFSTNWSFGVSGWYLARSGELHANNANFRGQIVGGAYSGYAWPANGGTGYYIGPSGLLLGNANTGKYFQVSADGDIHAPGFSVVNGVMSVSQINLIDTVNLRSQSVTIPSGKTALASTVSVTVTITEDYPVFVAGTLVQSVYSRIILTRNGVSIWEELPGAGTLASKSIVDYPGPGTWTYRLYSDNVANDNGTTLFVMAIKR